MHLLHLVIAWCSFAAAGSGHTFAGVQYIFGSKTSSRGLAIPPIGFGTWNLSLENHNASEAVSSAIQVGYRHVDCAAAYHNEQEVGRGIAEGLSKSNLERERIWVTSKLWNDR